MTRDDSKDGLRASMLDRLRGLDAGDVAAQSSEACRALLESGLLDRARGSGGLIAGYVALPIGRGAEVDPLGVLRACARVALPRVDWSAGVFELQECPGVGWESQLVEGRFGLLEPPTSWPIVRAGSVGGALVPGVAFDRRGGRLGRGAGMYDRFLAALPPGTPTIGLALREQVVDRVPVDGHDVRLSCVVTCDGVLAGGGPDEP